MKNAVKGLFGNGKLSEKDWMSLGKDGIDALAKSVKSEVEKSQDSTSFKMHIRIPHHNTEFDVQMKEGENIMTYATSCEILSEYLECTCGGNMSCATCHVSLDSTTYKKLKAPCEAELDMLDLAYEPTDTSRLGCQIYATKDTENMIITIPSGINNFWS